MTRRLITTGSPFEENYAYSRAVVQGDWCFVAGTTGFDYKTMTMPDSVADQTRNTFETIKSALDDAGFAMSDIVRVHIIVTEPGFMDEAAPVLREYLGDVWPANMAFVSQLLNPAMKIEIEATAYRGS